MTAYVVAGYAAVFGGLGLYAYRLVLRIRRAASSVLVSSKANTP